MIDLFVFRSQRHKIVWTKASVWQQELKDLKCKEFSLRTNILLIGKWLLDILQFKRFGRKLIAWKFKKTPNMENEDYIIEHLVTNCTNATNSSCGYPDHEPSEDYFLFVLFKIVVPITYGLISLIGFIGNLLVIYVILSKHKMRTVTNILLLNLALADLSFVLIVPPFTAYYWAVNVWRLGTVLCKAMQYLLNVTAYVTVYTLVLISIIRYLTIVYSAQTMRFRTKQNMVIMNILIWVVMLAVNIPIILSYVVKDEQGEPQCTAQGPKEMYANFFAWAYLLPLTIIAIFSICILRHIRKAKPTMLNKKTKSDDRKKQAARVIILVVVIFGISWLPIHIHLLVYYFYQVPQSNFYTAVSVFWNALAYTNSCVNPIIYNYASKDFRDSFREVIHCKPHDLRSRSSRGNETTVMTRATLNSTPNGGEMKNLCPKENGEKEKLMETAGVWALTILNGGDSKLCAKPSVGVWVLIYRETSSPHLLTLYIYH